MRFARTEDREALLAGVAEELRLHGAAAELAAQALADHLRLNRTDVRCLEIIQRLDGVTAGRLATEAGLSSGATTTVLDRLERAGLAQRVQDADDRRRVLVELTPPARRALEAAAAPLAEATARRLEGYSAEELALVRDFMGGARRLNEEHAHRLRAGQRGEAAS